MSRSCHPSSFYYPPGEQYKIGFLAVQLLPVSCYLLTLWSVLEYAMLLSTEVSLEDTSYVKLPVQLVDSKTFHW